MRALVIGADGFVGRHLVAHLRASGDVVTEAAGTKSQPGARLTVDVRDPRSVDDLFKGRSFDSVYHLAAVAFGPDASADVSAALDVTVRGTVNVVEAIAREESRPIVLVTGSSEVYGDPSAESITEDAPLDPVTVYGATKLAQETMARACGRARDVPVVVTRSFNHIGPGQRDTFAIASFARQLLEIKRGTVSPTVTVGNLTPVRDFTDVRDVVRAYRLLVDRRVADIPVNVCSGVGVAIGDVLQQLVDVSGIGVTIEVDPTKIRRHDAPRVVGSASRLRELTGWSPTIGLRQTLADIWHDAQLRW